MDNDTLERASFCALNRIFGFEPSIAHAIVGKTGSASAIFSMNRDERSDLLGRFSKYTDLTTRQELDKSLMELEGLPGKGCRFITIADSDYPALLKECPDPPLGLYFRSGSPPSEVFGLRPQIAIVGTRDISLCGKDNCRQIVEAMSHAKRKPLIVSGFALGTDIIAQASALEGGLPTVAVLPTGIDDIYPRRHWRWAERILSTPGCALVTDYPPGTGACAINFLRRNRIIAGLTEATILIESKIKGGGLITADFAFSYDRDVYAVPGRLDDTRSQGCNALIKRKIAEPVIDIPSLISELGLGGGGRILAKDLPARIKELFSPTLSPDMVLRLTDVAQCIRRNRGITPEEIAVRLGLDFSSAETAVNLLLGEGIIETDLLQGCGIKTNKV